MAEEATVPDAELPSESPETVVKRWRRTRRVVKAVVALTVIWLVCAYLVLPMLWRHYEHNPGLEDAPKTTLTGQGIPGDPLNVGFIGSEEELDRAMLESGWEPADPVTLRSSLKIATSVILDRAYKEAPISPLFLFGRKQDLAFQKSSGKSARRRHHVRYWKSVDLGKSGVPLWIGAVTYDKSVGFSHRTGQITHHIAPDIDAERDGLVADLRTHGFLSELYQVTGVGATVLGRNGGGDLYYTDGELTVGVLASAAQTDHMAARLENPPAVQIKEQLWTALRPILQTLPGQ